MSAEIITIAEARLRQFRGGPPARGTDREAYARALAEQKVADDTRCAPCDPDPQDAS